MRILHVTEAADYGVLRHLVCLVPEMQRLGHECQALFLGGRIADDVHLPCQVIRHPQKGGCLLNLPDSILAIRRYVKEIAPDIVHLHAFKAALAGRIALAHCIYSPHAFKIHLPLNPFVRGMVRGAERLLAHRTCSYALVSQSEYADGVELSLPAASMHICPNGLPNDIVDKFLPRTTARLAIEKLVPSLFVDGVRVGVVPTRIVPQKNPLLVLEAMKLLRSLPIRILFCGDGELLPLLRRQAAPNLFFAGRVPDLWRYLRAFDFAVLPSFYEGLSYSLLECLAAGLPMALSSTALPSADFLDYLTIFSPASAESAAAAIKHIHTMPPQKSFIPFTAEEQAMQLLEIYKQAENQNVIA